jgi:DNA-binding transcriptional ArsR family regulator
VVDYAASQDWHSPLNATDRLFEALSDRTRRGVIEMLVAGPRKSGDLARSLAVSPQALSRHLRLLRQSGLVSSDGLDEDARIRTYKLEADALSPLKSWLERTEMMWQEQLSAFKDYAESHRT